MCTGDNDEFEITSEIVSAAKGPRYLSLVLSSVLTATAQSQPDIHTSEMGTLAEPPEGSTFGLDHTHFGQAHRSSVICHHPAPSLVV